MRCWSCSKDTMVLRKDERNYECGCGATENIGGATDTDNPPAKKWRKKP